jgi:NAD(P)-dependent dehydrogenase (short-subunit alcohol dehydrogenase family)
MDQPSLEGLLDFTGKGVLITGSGQGIGSDMALRFAEAGADVAVHYRSSAGGASDVVSRIESMGRKAVALRADVTIEEDVRILVEAARDGMGRLDVLINNAGSYPVSTIVEMSVEEWRSVIDSNLQSAFLCTQAVARQWIDNETGGAIVNIASIEGEAPAPMHSHYDAAKAGVIMLTRNAAQELGPSGIRVNSVSPGLIWRSGIEEAWPDGVNRWIEASPLGSMGHPNDVADACLFLASDASRWITGANLRVDGGVMSKPVF